MDLFAAFHDELEKISSHKKTLTEQRDSARRGRNILATLALAGAGAGIADSHFKAKKRAAEAAQKAAKKPARSALSRGARAANRVAGKAVGAGLGLASLGLIAGSLKRRRPSPELKRLYALPSATFTHPVK